MTPTTSYIIIHEDGTHVRLQSDEVTPSETHIGRVEDHLKQQSRRGYLVKVEGDIKRDGTITKIRPMNAPEKEFDAVKASFIGKRGGIRRPQTME